MGGARGARSSATTPTGRPTSAPSYEVDTTIQEMAENGVDSAHFRYVHNTAEVPVMESYETGFPMSQMKSNQKFPTPRGVMEGRIDSTSYGPGCRSSRSRASSTRSTSRSRRPIEADKCVIRFNFRVQDHG